VAKKHNLKGSDLLEIFDDINEEYFYGSICGGIGFRRLKITKEETTLGDCVYWERFIRVNKIMDDADVPDWALRFLVYHEMLHLHLPPEGDHEDPHSPEFLALERKHPDYRRYLSWSEGPFHSIVSKWLKKP